MIIHEIDTSPKIPYEVEGNRITFDDDLTINLAKREEDWPVHIDICYDIDRSLVIGTSAANAYVAQIDIPAREYWQSTKEDENGEMVPVQNPVPFSMDKVVLTLWPVNQ